MRHRLAEVYDLSIASLALLVVCDATGVLLRGFAGVGGFPMLEFLAEVHDMGNTILTRTECLTYVCWGKRMTTVREFALLVDLSEESPDLCAALLKLLKMSIGTWTVASQQAKDIMQVPAWIFWNKKHPLFGYDFVHVHKSEHVVS